jgi:hypothetical protein
LSRALTGVLPSGRLGVEGGLVLGGIGLREVPVWSAVERVDVRCRFKTGPVEEVRFEGLQGWALTCPVQFVVQG